MKKKKKKNWCPSAGVERHALLNLSSEMQPLELATEGLLELGIKFNGTYICT